MKLDLIDILKIFKQATIDVSDKELTINSFAMLKDPAEANSDRFLKTSSYDSQGINWRREGANLNIDAIICFNDKSRYNSTKLFEVYEVPVYVLFKIKQNEPFEITEAKAAMVLKRFINELFQYGYKNGQWIKSEPNLFKQRIENRNNLTFTKERLAQYHSIGIVLNIKGTICKL